MNRAMAWVLLALLAATGCGEKTAKKAAPAATNGGSTTGAGNPLTAPVDYLGAVGAAQKQAQRFGDLTPVQQAVRAFQAGEERMPANLQELVTEGYLPKLPVPPKGFALVYDPRTGQVRFAPAGQDR